MLAAGGNKKRERGERERERGDRDMDRERERDKSGRRRPIWSLCVYCYEWIKGAYGHICDT